MGYQSQFQFSIMANSAKSSGFFSFLSNSPKDEEEEFQGKIFFNKRTISFPGTTLYLKNIAKFEKYGLKYIYKVSTLSLIFSSIMAIGGLKYAPIGLVLTLFFGLNVYVGIKERLRPKLYGLTIELNSGTTQSFLSKDTQGINALFEAVIHALENDVQIVADFGNKGVTNNYNLLGDNIGGAFGEKAESTGNTFS